jgi:hypothetical protein
MTLSCSPTTTSSARRRHGNQGDKRHPSTEALWDEVLTAGAMVYGVASDDAHHYYDAEGLTARGETVYTGDQARFSFAKAPPGYVRAVVEDQRGRKAWLQPVRVPVAVVGTANFRLERQ